MSRVPVSGRGSLVCMPAVRAPGYAIFSGDQNRFRLECIMEKAPLVEGHEGYSTTHLLYQFTPFLYVKEKPVQGCLHRVRIGASDVREIDHSILASPPCSRGCRGSEQ